jgi:adenosylhomocysteine nucleosidase
MPEEVERITGALEERRVEPYAGVDYHIGRRAGKTLVICCAGMGKVNAASTTQVLITKFKADAIILSGIAGNMCADIGIGDVVIGREVVYHDADLRMIAQSAPGSRSYKADPLLVEAARQACALLGVRFAEGLIATGDGFVGDADTKNRIKQQCNPRCVEMEGAAVGHVAARNGIPFVVLRTMSDSCEESIESLGAEVFDVAKYAHTAAAIVAAMLEFLNKPAP